MAWQMQRLAEAEVERLPEISGRSKQLLILAKHIRNCQGRNGILNFWKSFQEINRTLPLIIKTVFNSGSCLWLWVLVLCLRFVVSGLISQRHSFTHPLEQIWKFTLFVYWSMTLSSKNSNISNKFKKLLNTISHVKFTYDVCVPHIFVMRFS